MSTVVLTNLEQITCGTCGIPHAVPADWIANRRRDGGDIHCPNGCIRTWRETELDRVRKQLAIRDRELREAKCDSLKKQQLLEQEQMNRAHIERKLKRVDKGVCPCCKRTFQNLARHMAAKHSGENKEREKHE